MQSKIVLTVFLLATFQAIWADTEDCTNANEEFSDCGNLCEDTCANVCEPPKFQAFSLFVASNPNCVPGCYCSSGFIRDDNGDCVSNVPGVCSEFFFIEDFLFQV
jgi:Trypsin Inhibitor like cysteine rich domain